MNEVTNRFLLEERTHSGPRIDPVDRARFHRMVQLCAEIWHRHGATSLRMVKGKQGVSLFFDGPMGGRDMALFTLRVDYKRGEYRFTGPNADRERMGLGPQSLETLDRLRDLYAALLADGPVSELAVTTILRGKPFPDLLPLVEETRRVLDTTPGGSSSGGGGRTRKEARDRVSPERGTAGHDAKAAGASTTKKGSARGASRKEPTLSTIILSCPEPKESAAFYRRIFGVKSEGKLRPQDHAIYAMGEVRLVLRKELSSEERRRLGCGMVQKNRGWGLVIGFEVPDFTACLRRVRRVPGALISEDQKGGTVLVKDPAGYVLEISSAP